MAFSYVLPALLLLAAVVTVSRADSSDDWCDIESCSWRPGVKMSDHTWCKYDIEWNKDKCGKIIQQNPDVSEEDIQLILDEHNRLRRFVAKGQEDRGLSPYRQPEAANMQELVWDNDLAKLARTWVQQCDEEPHDKCRDLPQFQVGQNGFKNENSKIPTIDWTKPIYAWYDEVDKVYNEDVFRMLPASDERFKEIGHYTQFVWAKTNKVGCAVATYKPKGSKRYIAKYICNYGPAGNFPGEEVYQWGRVGSACPKGTWNNDGLCSSKRRN